MISLNVKREGRIGVPYKGRLYSASWLTDGKTVTVTWHHFKTNANLQNYEEDPTKLAKELLLAIIREVSPPAKN